jgi:hypothetical protein
MNYIHVHQYGTQMQNIFLQKIKFKNVLFLSPFLQFHAIKKISKISHKV